jgi:hypothetical protein
MSWSFASASGSFHTADWRVLGKQMQSDLVLMRADRSDVRISSSLSERVMFSSYVASLGVVVSVRTAGPVAGGANSGQHTRSAPYAGVAPAGEI